MVSLALLVSAWSSVLPPVRPPLPPSPHLAVGVQNLESGNPEIWENWNNQKSGIQHPSPLLTGYPMESQTGYIQIQIHL